MKHGCIQPEYKKRLLHRLKILRGQIGGLEKVVEAEAYCVDILHQSLAVQESLKSFDTLMLENHLQTHAMKQLSGTKRGETVLELLKIYKLQRK